MPATRIAVLALTMIALAASVANRASGDDGSIPPRYVIGPRYALQLPVPADIDDIERGKRVLTLLEHFATRLDDELTKADAMPKSLIPSKEAIDRFNEVGAETALEIPEARTTHRMLVVLERTREDMERVGSELRVAVNTQGTCFYNNGRTALLGVVQAPGSAVDVPVLLHWGVLQYMYDRLGLYYNRLQQPTGVCVPEGLAYFMGWSHIATPGELPRELGGIRQTYGDTVRGRLGGAEAKEFPSLEQLFAAKPADFDKDGDRLYGPAVLLAEFAWEDSEDSRASYIRALRDIAKTGAPVKDFSLDLFVKAFRKQYKTEKKFEAAFHEFVTARSAEVNTRKQTQ